VHGDSVADEEDPFPRNLHGMAYPCEERDGYCVVYVPEAGRGRVKAEDAALSPVPEAPKFGARYRKRASDGDLPCNVDHGIIGLMDPGTDRLASGVVVAETGQHSREEKRFEPIPQGFRMATHAPSANSAPYKLLACMASRSRRRSILCCRTGGTRRFGAGTNGFRA